MSTTATSDFPSILDLGRLAASVGCRSSMYGDYSGSPQEKIDAKHGASLCLDLLNNSNASSQAEGLRRLAT
jgi:hypothetical protein